MCGTSRRAGRRIPRARGAAASAPLRILSGGQTGVDRAALDVALALGLPCGGWCPRGRRAEDGPIDARYPLRETPGRSYAERTARNVRDADADPAAVQAWLAEHGVRVLDVAGPRESQSPGIGARARAFLEAVLRRDGGAPG